MSLLIEMVRLRFWAIFSSLMVLCQILSLFIVITGNYMNWVGWLAGWINVSGLLGLGFGWKVGTKAFWKAYFYISIIIAIAAGTLGASSTTGWTIPILILFIIQCIGLYKFAYRS
jgi:hypothetical protein